MLSSWFLFTTTATGWVYSEHLSRKRNEMFAPTGMHAVAMSHSNCEGSSENDTAKYLATTELKPKYPLSVEDIVSRFPSLEEPLHRAPLLGLYFCASWCPDCWKATPVVEKVISNQSYDDKQLIDVVYISSDKTAEEMAAYKPRIFSEVPFENMMERANLKRQFGCCARKEMEELEMTEGDRKHGTPTLIIVQSATGRVLTEYGVSNSMNGGSAEDILEGWKLMVTDSHDDDDDIMGLLASTNKKNP